MHCLNGSQTFGCRQDGANWGISRKKMGKGRMFTNLHSLEKLGKAPSAPGFPEKQDFSKLEDSVFGWRGGLSLRFKRSRNPPALAAEVPRRAQARANQNCSDNPPL